MIKQDAIDWLMRLSFIGAYELSVLQGVSERETSWTLLDLEKLGWLDSLRASSPELHDDMLYLLSPAGISKLEELSCQPGLEHHFPVRLRDVVRRVASLEITTAFKRFAAELGDAVYCDRDLDLLDLRALPAGGPAHLRWWPPGVQGYHCVRRGGDAAHAPFFIGQ